MLKYIAPGCLVVLGVSGHIQVKNSFEVLNFIQLGPSGQAKSKAAFISPALLPGFLPHSWEDRGYEGS